MALFELTLRLVQIGFTRSNWFHIIGVENRSLRLVWYLLCLSEICQFSSSLAGYSLPMMSVGALEGVRHLSLGSRGLVLYHCRALCPFSSHRG